MTLYATLLWIYVLMASVVFGAAMYESFVVHPAWGRKPPESLVAFVGEPIGRMNIAAFWAPVVPVYALSGLGSWVASLSAGSRNLPLTVSVACAVSAFAWTLVYFRPMVTRFLDPAGCSIPVERQQAEVRRWILLNWFRVALAAVSWWGALRATMASS